MSTIRKIPFIESVLSGLSKGLLNNLKTILDSNESNVELGFGNLPNVNTITPTNFKLDVNNKKSGILIYTSDICVLIAYHRFQDLQLFKLNVSNSTYEKINEYCDINELRRILDDSLETVGENILNVESSSGELEDSDIEALKLPNAAIEYNDAIYYKDTQDDNKIVFKALPRIVEDTTYLDTITVNLSDNTYSLSTPAIVAGESYTPTYDTELSDISTNAVQNKTITEALEEKADVEEISDGTIVADKANKDGNGNTINTTYAKQTKVDALETSIGQIQEQIAGSNIEIPEEKISYQTVIPETLEYNDLIYKRNDKITTAILSKLGGLTKKYNQYCPDNLKTFVSNTADTKTVFNLAIQVYNNNSFVSTLYNQNFTTTGIINLLLNIPNNVNGNEVRIKHNGSVNDIIIATFNMNIIQSHKLFFAVNMTGINPLVVGGLSGKDLSLTDLTTFYGTGNEPTTVDQFLTDYPIFRGYVPYTIGAMDYAYTKKVDITGFNIWDEEWELGSYNISNGEKTSDDERIRSKNFIPVIPESTYYFKGSVNFGIICFYDKNKNFVDTVGAVANTTLTIPSNVCYINFSISGTTYNNDICINVSNVSLNGTYKPSYKNTLLQAKIVAIKQKLVSLGYSEYALGYGLDNVYNYIDLENKQVVLKMLNVDLGSLDYSYDSQYQLFSATIVGGKIPTSASGGNNAICLKYIRSNGRYYNMTNETFLFGDSGFSGQPKILIKDTSYTDANTFKTAMSGVPLIYELATPVTVDVSDILDNDDIIGELESGGTITFENDDMYPVVSNIKYYCYNVEESIIEGDSDSNTTGTDITLSDEYIHYQQTAGALMFVVAGKFTIADTINAGDVMLTSLFTIDETAGQYIYPIEDENVDFNIVDCSKDVIVNPTTLTTNADTISVLEKGSNTSIRYRMVANESINAGSYVFRFAITLKL